MLPYMEQDALFREFHLDEPWDSPHNIKLLERMPQTFAPFRGGKGNPPYTTYYRVFVGKNTPFGEQAKPEDFKRGMSNTLMLVEAGEPVPWTKPDELEYSPDQPLPPLGGVFRENMRVAFFDMHVENLPKPLDEARIRKMIVLKDD
jgi:hypothetical protein